MSVEVGQVAPKIQLLNTEMETVEPALGSKPVGLFFFPLAFTPV